MMRSLLFVPGDSERKLARARTVPADGLLLDLEDAVVEAQKGAAREMVAAFVSDAEDDLRRRIWIRLNALDSGMLDEDLAVVGGRGVAGYMLPKARSADDIATLATKLDGIERPAHIEPPRILAMAAEVPEALFNLGSYAQAPPRLAGLSWGPEDLSSALGASAPNDDDGSWTFVCRLARALTLAAARAAGVMALETVYTDYRNADGLARVAAQARADGFDGMLAIHPDQVEIINRAFMPGDDEIEHARRVLAAFEAAPDSGTVGLDGKMLDMPHRRIAERILALVASIDDRGSA